MADTYKKIESNLARVRDRIAAAAERAGRNAEEITLVAVTKSVGISEIELLKSLGVRHFGENRVERAGERIAAVQDVTWHMIGNLQRRKVREAVSLFDIIDAVDRLSLAQTIQQRCAELGRRMDVLVEVNVSGEAAKHGLAPEDLPPAVEAMRALDHIRVRGLMTMAPQEAEETELRKLFSTLRSLAEALRLKEISMGMSDDFEIAVEEGATQVRIGSALFE